MFPEGSGCVRWWSGSSAIALFRYATLSAIGLLVKRLSSCAVRYEYNEAIERLSNRRGWQVRDAFFVFPEKNYLQS